jgi:Raf kinase inhibitor-like YbhB/YbcL family protein
LAYLVFTPYYHINYSCYYYLMIFPAKTLITACDKEENGSTMGLRFITLIGLIVIISGCTVVKENADIKDKGVDNMQNISVSSEAFREGEKIPPEYTCDGSDVSPALSWAGLPAGTKSITLIMDDPDAPGGTFVHWVLYNIPPDTQKLPKGIPGDRTLPDGSVHGSTSFGRNKIGYGGPCPPPGNPHRYYFKVYSLDKRLPLAPGASKAEVEKAMSGHLLAKGEVMGKYGR